MKNGITISEHTDLNGTHTIFISNIGGYPNMFNKIWRIIREFSSGPDFFWGHYKTDGMHLSNTEFSLYSKEIPAYYTEHGIYHKIVLKDGNTPKFFYSPSELVACRTPNNPKAYQMMSKIFHYYLETVLFCPKIDWETFVDSHSNYMTNAARDYVAKDYTDFLFAYVDSGDFSISFNPVRFDPLIVRERVDSLLENKTRGRFA